VLGLTPNPTIKLYKGQTYIFDISSPGNPFSIKTARTVGFLDRYTDVGVDGYAVENGTITFTVPDNAPKTLYYVSESNADVGGIFEIYSINENTFIDVEKEIIGKKTFTLENGTSLSNGMKVSFIGTVTPNEYATGHFYVEGVGTGIRLINESTLEIIGPYTVTESVLFDDTPFDSLPFSNASSYPQTPDYIVIDRSSNDHNPWSRNNRWFHIDVIKKSAELNGTVASLDQTARATRPIIEFETGLKLFNFGTNAITDVDLVDSFTTDIFSNIEGQLGYNIDGIDLIDGQLILVTADTDMQVVNKIYQVNFVTVHNSTSNVRLINLVEYATPNLNDVVLIRSGKSAQGYMYWYDGVSWNIAQQKNQLNQTPLFDIVDDNNVSYGNKSTYAGSTFIGTKLFSYKVGTGSDDTVLGFPLSYGNINNIGDILFNFDLATDSFSYKDTSKIITKNINVGYLVKTNNNNVLSYVNGWQTSANTTTQAAIRIYKNSGWINNFPLDIFDNINGLDDLKLVIYVNGIRLDSVNWNFTTDTTAIRNPLYKQITLVNDIALSDVLTMRAFSKQAINSNGFYEIPYNLQNNPFNELITNFSLGEVIDHVNSIVDNLPNTISFVGTSPGTNNLRDLGNITLYGTKFLQHSAPLSLSIYHITSEQNNIVRAIEHSKIEYSKFKRNFIKTSESLGVDTNPTTMVDLILQKMTKDRPNTDPYYFSDMVPFGPSIKTEISVIDYRIKSYPLSNVFSLDSLSTTAVLVYLNGTQLLYEHDYSFDDQGFVIISAELHNDDIITINEYDSTNGCFVPPTPSKLGIWPTYDPRAYLDTALLNPTWMIQGHDGSHTVLYGEIVNGVFTDFRDAILLELEKRIYNNIKVKYDSSIFDIYDIIPGYNRTTEYSLTEFNEILAPNFYKWVKVVGADYTQNIKFDRTISLTFNYKDFDLPNSTSCPGYWRGIYNYVLDTDSPDQTPWEMLGFNDKPTWWEQVYGSAPYTSDNLIMWQDLTDGVVRQPNVPTIKLLNFVRPDLINRIPVDSDGTLLDPLTAGWATGPVTASIADDFVFGDQGPVEGAWRRSSDYPFSFLITAMLMHPAKTFGTLLDRSRVIRNLAGQLIYSDTGLRVNPSTIAIPSIYSSATKIQTSGIINYLTDYIVGLDLTAYTQYIYDLNNINAQLSYRAGAFSSKEQFNLILDSRSPLSTGGVFVPNENYTLILNSSSPVKKITYSGVIITKLANGFEIKGYSQVDPYFTYYQWNVTGINVTVGGISETFSTWVAGNEYYAGTIVKYNENFYRVLVTNTSTPLDTAYYEKLPTLPIIGGCSARLRTGWNRTNPVVMSYGTMLRTIQDVVDFLLGYEQWLIDQGFRFDNFSDSLSVVTNWTTSAKEFMFWTTQNWSTGEDKWKQWLPNIEFVGGTIVQYEGDYYRVIRSSINSSNFNSSDFVKLEGLSTIGSSVISLSPAAASLTFITNNCVVDDITNPFYTYEIFKVDGTPIDPSTIDVYRNENTVTYSPEENDGIYNATFYLVQKEQIILLDQKTIFNDLIYSPATGYRQERIKVSAHVSTVWDGSFNIPGFIFDQAVFKNWVEWQDYQLGDVVKYQQFYYSANSFLPGTSAFTPSEWTQLSSKPSPKLIPNWTYKAGQFTDFYSLDSDNFDSNQQTMAHHLIGYQKRQYLDNIIQDDVSEFKFYQGMIRDKGTQNVFNNLFNVLTEEGKESLKFYEEWAVRVGQYGANSGFNEIEFILDEAKFNNNPQGVELLDTVPPIYQTLSYTVTDVKITNGGSGYESNEKFNLTVTTSTGTCVFNVRTDSTGKIIAINRIVNSGSFSSVGTITDTSGNLGSGAAFSLTYGIVSPSLDNLTIVQTPNDVYLKPLGYTSSPWPVLANFNPYLRSAGYARLTDVKVAIGTLDALLTNTVWDSGVQYYATNIVTYAADHTGKYKIYIAKIDNINVAPSDTSTAWSLINMGDYIWCGFDKQDWNVYRYSSAYMNVLDIVGVIVNGVQELEITTDALVTVQVGSVIALEQVDSSLAGFYKVVSVNLNAFNVVSSSTPASVTFTDQTNVVVFTLTSQRTSSIDSAEPITSLNLLPNELMWTDENGNGNGQWATWEYNKVYNQSIIINTSPHAFSQYGLSIATTNSTDFLVTTDNSGTLYVRDKASLNSSWLVRQTVPPEFISTYTDPNFTNHYIGDILAISSQEIIAADNWVAVGIPQASHVCTRYKGAWQHLSSYNIKDIIRDPISGEFYKATQNVPEDYPPTCLVTAISNNRVINQLGSGPANPGQSIIFKQTIGNLIADVVYYVSRILSDTAFTVSDTFEGNELTLTNDTNSNGVIVTLWADYWNITQYIPVDAGGTNSSLMKQGAVTLYKVNDNNIITLVDTIISPSPAENEQFGANLTFGNGTFFINAPGGNNGKGVVYQLTYQPVIYASVYYNPIGSNGTIIKVSNTAKIAVGMSIVGTGFTTGQIVARIIDSTTIQSDVEPDSQPVGILEFVILQWTWQDKVGITHNNVAIGGNFGYRMAMSKDVSTLLICSAGVSIIGAVNPGRVFVYNSDDSISYYLSQVITDTEGDGLGFGQGVDVSYAADYIVISSVLYDGLKINEGKVEIYEYGDTQYVPYQKITNIAPETSQHFGSYVSFMNDFDTLVVFSRSSVRYDPIIFDENNTTFDEKSTIFSLATKGEGRVDIYDQYGSYWIFTESLDNLDDNESQYGYSISTGDDTVILSSIYGFDLNVRSGIVYEYKKPINSFTWTIVNQEIDKVDVKKIKKAFLYNKKTDTIVTHLDVVDPLQGKILGVADEELTYKSYFDPAVYSNSDGTIPSSSGQAWTTAQVGQLWWDLRTAKFFNCYDSDVVYRNNTWNQLFPGASIDIYEWVESSILPSDWDATTDTAAGLARGISGTSLYGNSAYSIITKYDELNEVFSNTYYFWVKNKTLVPDVSNRNISANDVANLISNPRGNGYEFIAFTGVNSFSLFNVKPLLQSSDIVLSVQYWIIDKIDQNIHSQWELISTDPTTKLPELIEQKWIDSLCGTDAKNRTVPDLQLPVKIRYGVENRPRQSMVVNRFEALKQVIEQANRVLIKHQIVNQYDLSRLEAAQPIPTTVDGVYDTVIDTVEELSYINISDFVMPSIVPTIVNGRIIDIVIVDAGKGYINAPFIDIVGSGSGAILKTKINSYGQINGVEIISSGIGYDSSTILSVRTYSTLVRNDSTAKNKWSIYYYDSINTVWSKVDTQAYDTTQYWNYTDWYAPGYNQFTVVNFVVNTFIELKDLYSLVGSLVKVLTNNSGKWVLLEKYADSSSIDWTQSYSIVGLQDGTIQLSSSLYEFDNTVYGYDSSLYDLEVYDDYASTELRYIFEAFKYDIFVGDLVQEYLNLFFTSVRYILSEQLYVDWIFKTSFIKAEHNVGSLIQKVTYNNDHLADFQSYVSEVKPYRTKIREYVSNYNSVDINYQAATDFDLPTVLENGKLVPALVEVSNDTIVSYDTITETYPWKFWADNVGFSITELVIVDGGNGYITQPTVEITSNSGSGAHAIAYIAKGTVNRIVLINGGSKYLSVPTVKINGGLSSSGSPAKVIAKIGNGVVRSNLISIKFDRTTQKYFITELQELETAIGTGSKKQFTLAWAPDVRVGYSSVTVNGSNVLRDDYTLTVVKSKSSGYTRYSGLITFNTAPIKGSIIEVTYIKDWLVLNAADRIQYYYDPATGETGKDLDQLMSGVDYGGVTVNGIGFDMYYGWDGSPYFSDRWDSSDDTFTDYIVTLTSVTHTFTLPYVPASGTEINVYYAPNGTNKVNAVRLDNPGFIGHAQWDNPYAIMPPIIMDGRTSTVSVPNTFTVHIGDTFIFRQSTSDGSLAPIPDDYDTAINGGALSNIGGVYTTATGLAADDIIIDGDGFVTQTTSSATEEIVPGQVVDTVAIKVYDRPFSGSAKIKTDTFIGDGSRTEFEITQDPNNRQALLVKLISGYDNPTNQYTNVTILSKDEYTIDYQFNVRTVVLVDPPITGTIVSITSFGVSGSNILDFNSFVGDGVTDQYITTAPWLALLTISIFVNGNMLSSKNYEIFETDDTYELAKLVGINFNTPPAVGDQISYIIVSGSDQTYSIMESETIQTNGSLVYPLQNTIGDSKPYESNMLVRVGQDILKGPNNIYHTIRKATTNADLIYTISSDAALPNTADVNDVSVIISGTAVLKPNTDYIFDGSNMSIKITKTIAKKYVGAELTISIKQHPGYFYTPATTSSVASITFDVEYNNELVEIISFYKHDVLNINRTAINVTTNNSLTPNTIDYFTHLKIFNGQLQLGRTVVDDDYIWIIRNSKILTPSIDFRLNDDRSSVTLAAAPNTNDEFTLITFDDNILESGISYMQFKDMLNRYQYKRLSLNKRSKLYSDLLYNDTTILVVDASTFTLPNPSKNRPGVVEIRGERIEYFTINEHRENGILIFYVLGQLRRGTLGTGVSPVHKAGSYVQDIGSDENIPYADNTIVEQYTITNANNHNHIIPINFVPSLTVNNSWFTDYGYTLKGSFSNTVGYSVNDVVSYNGYYYVNMLSYVASTVNPTSIVPTNGQYWELYSSIPVGYQQCNDIEVFVGGYDNSLTWASNVHYTVGTIVNVGSYSYRCISEHTSSSYFRDDSTRWTFFIGNIRLRKEPYSMFNVNQAPTSPEGDIRFDADFAVDGVSKEIRLTNLLAVGTRVTVIKRTLVEWDSTTNILYDNNKIALFLKETPGIWYTGINKYESNKTTVTLDTYNASFDNAKNTFDQG